MKDLQKLIVVRHTSDDPRNMGHISDSGHEQMEGLAEKMMPHLAAYSPRDIVILTSPAPRAWESALILKIKFPNACFPEAHEALWSEDGRSQDFPKALEIIRARHKKSIPFVIIVVTHKEYGDGFLSYFCKHQLGREIDSPEIGLGQAVVFNLDTRSVIHLE